MSRLKRRTLLRTAAVATAALATGATLPRATAAERTKWPRAIRRLKPMTDGVVPISATERRGRVAKARKLMSDVGIDAIYLEPGTSMRYFLDFSFSVSERMVAALIPAEGEIVYIVPAFEENKAREGLVVPGDVRTWHEHEEPAAIVGDWIHGLNRKQPIVALEERVRFFLWENIRRHAPQTEFRLATAVTAGCRMVKSPAELALMQHASDVTIAAYRACIASLWEGMSQHDFREMSVEAHRALGYSGGIGANFAEASALPHGSSKPQALKKGDIVLMDGGCGVGGYRSDISRTVVFGTPTQRQKDVWNLEKAAQDAAAAAVRPGVPCEQIDAAARKVIVDGGFGPDYTYFTHRVGHGIGMDGHEWTYLVRGNTTPLEPGMCFSNEPGIYIPGEFGVRLEDCFHVTTDGGKFFSRQSPAIDQPFG